MWRSHCPISLCCAWCRCMSINNRFTVLYNELHNWIPKIIQPTETWFSNLIHARTHTHLASLLALLNTIFNFSNIACHMCLTNTNGELSTLILNPTLCWSLFVKLPLCVAKSLCDPRYGCDCLLETNRIHVSLILDFLTLSLPFFLKLYIVYGKIFQTSRPKNSSSCFTNTNLITNYLKACLFSFQAIASHYCMGKDHTFHNNKMSPSKLRP